MAGESWKPKDDTTGEAKQGNNSNLPLGQDTSGSQLGQAWGGSPQSWPPYCHYPFNYCPCCGRPNTPYQWTQSF